ncbi:MAG: ribosome silencing factor [Clostridiaceae bacterium]|nr:ribosome silencing factor [Clostridiaceae bacterium]
MENSKKIFDIVVKTLEDKKAKNIKAIDIRELTTIASYFIIASGTSVTHIKSLADNVEEKLIEEGIRPLHIEGYNNARWILMDYNDVVVHIFHEEDREYYGLERLWQDGKEIVLNSENDVANIRP